MFQLFASPNINDARFAAKRMTKGIFSNVDKRITEYCAAFGSLKQEFYDRLHVDTHLVVVDTKLVLGRVLQVVEGIGVLCPSVPSNTRG